jgi:hypothetical protein
MNLCSSRPIEFASYYGGVSGDTTNGTCRAVAGLRAGINDADLFQPEIYSAKFAVMHAVNRILHKTQDTAL